MDSFKGVSGFHYNPSHGSMGEGEGEEDFSGMLLDVYVHHARNIHNICIYHKQDVYAKFSLTYSPDETLSTQIIEAGGKNPEFNENLRMKVTQPDAVLKCEVWMLSRARNYLEDQLLGFALVPLSTVVAAKGKMTQDYTLSSTDLFHSPAGTVQLTLSLNNPLPIDPSDKPFPVSSPNSSITSEVVLLDPLEYGRIEFDDINVVKENQQMVSEYFDMAEHSSPSRPAGLGGPIAPFVHLGGSSQSMEDYDMNVNSGDDINRESYSPTASTHNSGLFNSTTTSLSDDRTSVDSTEKKQHEIGNNSQAELNQSSGTSPDTPTSKIMSGTGDNKEPSHSTKEELETGGKEHIVRGSAELGSVFKSPMGNINLEAEQNAMQQQIVDMYMRSMQQFTESLAKMKLPMDLDRPKSEDGENGIPNQNSNSGSDKNKKDGTRVFYGSRAFF